MTGSGRCCICARIWSYRYRPTLGPGRPGAGPRVSVARVLDGLDQFTLEVLDGLRAGPGRRRHGPGGPTCCPTTEAGLDAGLVRAAVDRLRRAFLVTAPTARCTWSAAIDELTCALPGRAGPPGRGTGPGRGELVADPAGLRRTLLSAPPEARAVLDRLAAGPPVGSVQPVALQPAARGLRRDPARPDRTRRSG